MISAYEFKNRRKFFMHNLRARYQFSKQKRDQGVGSSSLESKSYDTISLPHKLTDFSTVKVNNIGKDKMSIHKSQAVK